MECPANSDCVSNRIDLMQVGEESEKKIHVAKFDIHAQVKALLVEEDLDYVLITCRKVPNKKVKKNQKLEVELTFEGDPMLASYLVHGAQEYFDDICTIE